MIDPRTDAILDIVAKETNVPRDRLGLDVPMDSLGIPSLDMVQAVFALETHFGIELPVNESQGSSEFGTVGDLVQHVLRTISSQLGANEAGESPVGDARPDDAAFGTARTDRTTA